MGTIFMVFRLIFSPFKTIYSLMTGKKKKTNPILKPIKYALTIVISVFLFAVVIGALAEDETILVGNRKNEIYIQQVDGTLFDTDSSLRPDNPNGTVNGLNLLLIDSIQTEGYVKEILSLYRDSANNKLDDYEFQVPLEYKIGIQIDETGPYSQTLLPKSYLPTRNGVVVWKESFNGIPAEQMTVEKLNPDNAISLVASYPDVYGQMSYNVGTNMFQGLYQNQAGTEVNGFPASKLNWLGASSGRGARTYYQPDGMSYLNGRITRFVNNFFTNEYASKLKENPNIVNMCVAPIHNAGEAGFLSPLVYGSHWSDVATYDSASAYQALESLYNDLNSSISKNSKLKGCYFGHGGRFVGAYLLCEAGWYFTQDGLGFLEGSSGLTDEIASSLLGSGKTASDLMSYFRSKISSLPISDSQAVSNYGWYSASQPWKYYGSNSTKGFMFKYDPNKTTTFKSGTSVPFLSVINNESLGQLYSTLFHGSYIFANALKYAGVNVDPTDPNSYMNTLPQGEWKPSGDSVWMQDYIGNTSVVTEKREKILTEAYKWLGSWYVLGGWDPPVKDSSGNWINGSPISGNGSMKGFDCSRYVQYVYQTVLGVDISRSTWSQRANENTYVINQSELLPGDLVYYYGPSADWGHVSFYLGDKDGVRYYMHAPYDNKPLSITTWDGTPEYTLLEYRRVKGIE